MRMERALTELDAALKAWNQLPSDASPADERPFVRKYLRRYGVVMRATINTHADALATLDYFLKDKNYEGKATAAMLRRAVSVLVCARRGRVSAAHKRSNATARG